MSRNHLRFFNYIRTSLRIAIMTAAIGIGGLLPGCGPQAARPRQMVVRQVDHILIASTDAKELFTLLSETFQLPVAWPMAEYGNFSSGGVAVGNVNLEIIKADQTSRTAPPRWTGFALEPEPLTGAIGELKARGISYGRSAPFRSKQADGTMALRWTTVSLPDVSSENTGIFLCEYTHNVSERRGILGNQLKSRDGGPLGIISVSEIVYAAADLTQMQQRWQRLLDPIKASSAGAWPIGAGPSIRVIRAQQDGICELTVAVKSLERARRFLKEKGLLEVDQPTKLTAGGSLLKGLNITFIEGPV